MNKRVVAVFTAFAMLYGICCLRLYTLSSGTQATVQNRSVYTVEIGKIRGDIVDCKGRPLVSTDYDNIAVAKPTTKALAALRNVLDSKAYYDVSERMKNGKAVSVNIGKLEIEQNSDAVMLRKYRRNSSDQLARHIIGYLNSQGRGVTGIEKSFDELLYTDESLSARLTADVYGRILSGNRIEIKNSTLPTACVTLTLDSELQRAVENALDISDVVCGAAVVTEIETGAVRAIASRPDFDSDKLSESLADESSPLLNRALNPSAVGSVFKVAVTAAALESGIDDFFYECKGSCEVDGVTFSCNNRTAHGELDMTKALGCSCNTFFIELAKKTGARRILETASLLGFGQQTELADGIISKSGVLPTAEKLRQSGALANFSFGQGEFTATLLQLSTMMSAVAGSGRYTQPYIIEKVTASDGTAVHSHGKAYPVTALSASTAKRLTDMLISVVENGNAVKARLKNGISAAGKTSTAQTGVYKNGREIYNTWFAGFFPADNPKYTVVILKEDGGSGATDCAPVFKRIADKIISLEKIS